MFPSPVSGYVFYLFSCDTFLQKSVTAVFNLPKKIRKRKPCKKRRARREVNLRNRL